jgi:hypothetical protein
MSELDETARNRPKRLVSVTFKLEVPGSSPGGRTKLLNRLEPLLWLP